MNPGSYSGGFARKQPGRFTTILVVLIGLLTPTLLASAVVFLLRNAAHPKAAELGITVLFVDAATYLFALGMAIFGALVVLRSSNRRYGWLMLVTGFIIAFYLFTPQYAIYALLLEPEKELPLRMLFGGIWDVYQFFLVLIFSLVILFPDGKLPSHSNRRLSQDKTSRLWRAVYFLTMGGWVFSALVWALLHRPLYQASLVYETLISNPFGMIPDRYYPTFTLFLNFLELILIPASLLMGIASLVVRWRTASGEVRQQIKWVLYFFMLMLITVAISFIDSISREALGIDLGITSYTSAVIGLMIVAVVIALGFAVLKYRLYDIDLIINRTLVYGALTGTLGLIYYTSVVLLQQIFSTESPLIIVLSTLAIAALFSPLRWRIQEGIDQRFYRRKYDAQKTLETFSEVVRDEVESDKISESLLEAVEETLQPEHASLWLRKPE